MDNSIQSCRLRSELSKQNDCTLTDNKNKFRFGSQMAQINNFALNLYASSDGEQI